MIVEVTMMYDLRGKHILVTGATGLIGSAVVRRLLEEHSTLRVLTRDPGKAAGLARPGVEIYKGDIEDRNSMGPAISPKQLSRAESSASSMRALSRCMA